MESLLNDNQLDGFTGNIMRVLFSGRIFTPHPVIQYFPDETVQYMREDLVADINEMGECFRYSLYTAGMLMAFRIFEKTIKTHLEDDLNIKASSKLYKSIQHLNKSFSKDFVGRLQKIRKIRNKSIHSDRLFERDDAIDILDDIVWVLLFVYSIESE